MRDDFTFDYAGGSNLVRKPLLTPQDWLGQRRAQAALRASTIMTGLPSNFSPDRRAADLSLLSDAQSEMGINLQPQHLNDDLRTGLANNLQSKRARRVFDLNEQVANFMTDPINAELAYDDVNTLGFWGGLANATGRGGGGAADGIWYGSQRMAAINRLMRMDNAGKSLAEIYDERKDGESPSLWDKIRFAAPGTGALARLGDTAEVSSLRSYVAARLETLWNGDDAGGQRHDVQRRLSELILEESLRAEDRQDRFRGSQAFDRINARSAAQEGNGREGVLGGFMDIADLATEDPLGFTSWAFQIAAESVPSIALAAAVGVTTRSAGAAASTARITASGTMGAGSYARAEAGNFGELAQEMGYNLSDPADVRRLLQEPAVLARMQDQAFVYGATVGIFDGLSGGIAGQALAKSPVGDFMLQMVTQAALGSGGELFGKILSGQEVDWKEVILEGLIEMITGPLEVVGIGGRKAYGRLRDIQDANDRKAFIEAIGATGEASTLKGRAARKYQELVAMVTKDGPIENIHIDATALDAMLKQTGLTPEQLETAVPGFDVSAFRVALEQGGDVQLPTSSYAAHVVGTDLEKQLGEHIRFNPLERSLAEAKAERAELEAEITDVKATIESTQRQIALLSEQGQRAYEQLAGQLRQTGRSPGVAEKEAMILVRGLETRAKRAGISMTEALRRYGAPNVRGATAANMGSNTPREGQMTYERARRLLAEDGANPTPMAIILRRTLSDAGVEAETATDEQIRAAVTLAASRGELTTPLADEFYVLPEDEAEIDVTTLYQTVSLRQGEETLADYGLVTGRGGKARVRDVALAMERRQRKLYGKISRLKRTPAVIDKMSSWMAEEILFELAAPEKDSAIGWYTFKFQAALDRLADRFPELRPGSNQPIPDTLIKLGVTTTAEARSLMTMMIAVTSNGTRAIDNFRNAAEAYQQLRDNGSIDQGRGGGTRRGQIDTDLANIMKLIKEMGSISAAEAYLLEAMTVAEHKAQVKAGLSTANMAGMPNDMVLPRAAGLFGPKLGAFFANLMGQTGYLTMDLWWSRTINRYRGDVLPKVKGLNNTLHHGKPFGLHKFKILIGKPHLSDRVALNYATEYAQAYADRDYKDGTEAEMAANTIYKDAFTKLQEAPEGAADRAFMFKVATEAQRKVAERTGRHLTIADIQAVIWYYEKRLYADMGARERGDVSYLEAADMAVRAMAKADQGVEPQLVLTQMPIKPSGPAPEAQLTDDAGEAIDFYHGTNQAFTTFKPGMTFHTTRRSLAAEHALRAGTAGARVIRSNIGMKKPLVVDAGRDSGDTYWMRHSMQLEQDLVAGDHDGILIVADNGAELLAITTTPEQAITLPDAAPRTTLFQTPRGGVEQAFAAYQRAQSLHDPMSGRAASPEARAASIEAAEMRARLTPLEKFEYDVRVNPAVLDRPQFRDHWFVVTATRESVGDGTHKDNVKENEKLAARLRDELNMPFLELTGYYNGLDQGKAYLIYREPVEGLAPYGKTHGEALGAQLKQESILDKRGLVYTDGSTRLDVPYDGVLLDERARESGFLSVIEPGGRAFSMDLQWPMNGNIGLDPKTWPEGTYFGLHLEADGTAEMVHWSSLPLETIDPSYSGSGPLKGQERSRAQGFPGSYYGMNVGREGGYKKEAGLGRARHTVRFDPRKLYAIEFDPLNLRADIDPTLTQQQQIAAYEEKIIAAGFDGYFAIRGPLGAVAKLAVPLQVTNVTPEMLFQGGPAPIFKSALAMAIGNAKQEQALPRDWMAIIPKLPGVKQAEFLWTGLWAYLETMVEENPKRQLTRDSLVNFVWDNRVPIEVTDAGDNFQQWTEVGQGKVATTRENDVQYREMVITVPDLEGRGPNAPRDNPQVIANRSHYAEANVVAHYRVTDFTVGNQNISLLDEGQSDLATRWRKSATGQPTTEVLRARERGTDTRAMKQARDEYYAEYQEAQANHEREERSVLAMVELRAYDIADEIGRAEGLTSPEIDRLHATVRDAAEGAFRLLHRMQANTGNLDLGIAGEQFMAALEFGLRAPYPSPGVDLARHELLAKTFYKVKAAIEGRTDAQADNISASAKIAVQALLARREVEARPVPPIPDAAETPYTYTPFPDDEYVALVAKAFLREAIDADKDAILWTTGAQQGERYGMAVGEVIRRISNVTISAPIPVNDEGRFETMVRFSLEGMPDATLYMDPDGATVYDGTIDGQFPMPLADVLTPGLAEIVTAKIAAGGRTTLTTEEIAGAAKVERQGEGYVKVYDRMLRKFFDKWAAQFGGKVTIDDTTLQGGGTARDFTSPERIAATREFVAKAELHRSEVNDLIHNRWTEFVDNHAEGNSHLTEALQGIYDTDIQRSKRQVETAERNIKNRYVAIQANPGSADAADHANKIKDAKAFIAGVQERNLRLMEMEYDAEIASAMLQYINIRLEGFAREAEIEPTQSNRDAAIGVLRGVGFEVPAILETPPPLNTTPRAYWRLDLNPEMKAAGREGFALFQKQNTEGPLGAIVLPPEGGANPDMYLFDGANLSTVLHEGGHYFLWLLQQMAKDGDASARAELEILRVWWQNNAEAVAKDAGVPVALVRRYLVDGTTGDVETDKAINVGMHEQFARGFELYMFEGKSPSNEMRGLFESFSAWILSVYTQVKAKLGIELTDEVRGVFDRLLAVDSEIEQAQATSGLDHEAFAKAARAAGIDPEQAQRLADLSREAQDEARQLTLAAIMAPIARERKAEVIAFRKQVQAQVEEEVQNEPHNRVIQLIGNSRWLGGEVPANMQDVDLRFDTDMLIEETGDANIASKLPRGRRALAARGTGVSADEVAGLFGYATGAALINDLLTKPKAADVIKQRVDAAVNERFENTDVSEDVPQAALDAVHGDKRGQLIVAELRALARISNRSGKMTSRQQAAYIARETLRRMPARQAMQSNRFLAAERRHAENATREMAQGNHEAAFNEKRLQLIQHSLYVESRKATAEVGKLERLAGRLRKRSTRKALAGDYLEAIDEVLDLYDFRQLTAASEQRRGALLAYVDRMKRDGRENELAIPDHVLTRAQRTPYLTLSMQHLQGIYDTLKNIEHTARMKQKLKDARSEREMTALVDGITQSFSDNIKGRDVPRVDRRGNKIRSAIREYVNLILNSDTILRRIDGWTRGDAYKAIKDPLDAADNTARKMQLEAVDAMEALYSPYSKMERQRMALPKVWRGHPESFTKWELISIALNTGNADNFERLTSLDSRGRFSPEQVEALLDNLDERDWKFVQSVWDYTGTFYPLIAEREQRTTGVRPKKVEAREVETKFGTFRGGYYPIVYDARFSAKVVEEQQQLIMGGLMAGRFGKAQTANGHTKERAAGGGGRTVKLGMDVFHGHISSVIHDLAFSEAVNNAWKILQDPRVKGLFERNGMLEDHKSLEMWVQDIGTGIIMTTGVLGRAARHLKAGFTLSKLAFNMGTVALQITGVAQTMAVIGKRNTAIGYGKYAAGGFLPVAARVKARSLFMADRETTFNRDMFDLMNNIRSGPLSGPINRMQNILMRLGFYAMMKVQFYTIDVPAWIGAYEAEIKKGSTDQEAGDAADRMVARAQASGLFTDRSAIERGTLGPKQLQSDFVKLFTALGTYMFAKFNAATEVVGKTRQGMEQGGVKGFLALINGVVDLALLFTVEAVLAAIVRRQLPDDEDDEDDYTWAKFLARETALSVMGTMPFIRDGASVVQGFGGGGSYGGVIETLASPVRIFSDAEIGKADIKAAINTIGLAVPGVPSVAINRIVEAEAQARDGADIGIIDYIFGVKR